jgi:hypothetical protein
LSGAGAGSQARNLQQDLGGQGGVFADEAEKVGLGDDLIPVVVSSLWTSTLSLMIGHM